MYIYIYTHILKESRILIYQRSLLWLRNFFFFFSFLLPFSAHTFAKLSIKEKERGLGTGTALKNRRGERKSGARCRGINQRWEWYKNIEPRGGGLLASLLKKKKREKKREKKIVAGAAVISPLKKSRQLPRGGKKLNWIKCITVWKRH